MLQLFEAGKRYYDNFVSSQIYRLFSSHKFYDPANLNYGNILAINDYTLRPNMGYDMHPHVNLEQLFIFYSGTFLHRDYLGDEVLFNENDVQHITAGSGYARSLQNIGNSPARYIGIWLRPREQNTTPMQEFRRYTPDVWQNDLFPIASGGKDIRPKEQQIWFNAAATVYRGTLGGEKLTFSIGHEEKGLLYVFSGDAHCNDIRLSMGDHIRVKGADTLTLSSGTSAECIFIHMDDEQNDS